MEETKEKQLGEEPVEQKTPFLDLDDVFDSSVLEMPEIF